MACTLDNTRIVLVDPLYGGNLGAVCRAMMNMGISDLAIVAQRRKLDWSQAEKMAMHSKPILRSSKQFETLKEAVADCGIVAATTARTGFYRDHSQGPRESAERLMNAALDAPIALVFGPEDKGLDNEQLSLANLLVRIPSTEEYSSLNLSQAVMICCYELYLASGQFEAAEERYPEAPSELRERMFSMWRQALLDVGFMLPDKADHMMMGLRRIFSRGPLTTADVKILMGMARQTQWAANQLQLDDSSSPETQD